jgi:asparagine synthase (glutamine-hydrolysing)
MDRFAGELRVAGAVSLDSQPPAELHDGCQVLYCGYIANAHALIAEANRRGEVLTVASHGELFAKAYHWWGEGLQAHVLGEYAVAVFDASARSLLLTHDALGLVPLYYCRRLDTLAFASRLEDLLQLPWPDLDEEYLADYLATCRVISARTPYAGISRLVPGQSLHWLNQRMALRTTWSIARVEPITLRSDGEYEERLRDLLRDGVKASMSGPGQGKVWCELSGGLDSTSVLSTAVHSQTAELEAFSIVYSASQSADESEWMKVAVKEFSLPWHTLDGDETRPFSELPQRFAPEPTITLAAAALRSRYQALAESHGVRVILTGHGGDQVYCGDSPRPYYLADFLPLQLYRLWSGLRGWQGCNPEGRSLLHLLLREVGRPLLSYLRHRSLTASIWDAPPPWIDPAYLRSMQLARRSLRQIAPRCPFVGQQYFAERIATTGYRAQGVNEPVSSSFEYRYPLLYRPLVEFMAAIPWEQKIRPGQDRSLERRALQGILPEPIRQRKDKRGPDEAYFEGLRIGRWPELLVDRPRIVERGYVDGRLWRQAVSRARYGCLPTIKHFIAAATLEVWLRQLEDVRRNASSGSGPFQRFSPTILRNSASPDDRGPSVPEIVKKI